jgi:hypothetical protein
LAASISSIASAVDDRFDATISEPVLRNYLSRAITVGDLLAGRGNLTDNIRMLKATGAKYAGRSLLVWGDEIHLVEKLERAKHNAAKVHEAAPDIILEGCVFEIVSWEVGRIAVPDWVFKAFGRSVEKRNFRYEEIIYAGGRGRDQWGKGASVPDVSRPETKLWFFFLAASEIDAGMEAIHFGQVELMNGNDPRNEHWQQVLTLVRAYAAKHARRHLVLCNAHVPSGGLVRDDRLLLDFHAFPLRIVEVADHPQQGELRAGFIDSIYGRSKGGIAPSGWRCDHLPYLVELDNWGASDKPGQANVGGCWVWGYDEIGWFARQTKSYRDDWLWYAWKWVRQHDAAGYLEMPGIRDLASPVDGRRTYYANRPSEAVPDGFDQEETIRAIWAAAPLSASSEPITVFPSTRR